MKSFFLLFTALFAVSNVFASVSNIDELEKRCNKGEGHECWWLGEHYREFPAVSYSRRQEAR